MSERKPTYANARNILPADLLRLIRCHFPGGLLWIPSERDIFGERRSLVLEMKEMGVSTSEIAKLAKITPRRVRQIVAEAAKKDDSRASLNDCCESGFERNMLPPQISGQPG